MPCNICGEEYRGLALDCACTMYGVRDESELPPEELAKCRRAQRKSWWVRLHAPKFLRMSEAGNPVYRFPTWPKRVSQIIVVLTFVAFVVSLSGCAGGLQQVDDAFELSMVEYARKWEGGISHWAMEDIHIDTNRVVNDRHYNPKRPELNGYCWETAEMKHDLAVEKGFDPADMEIIVFILSEDTAIMGNVDSGSTHAVLRVGDTIYDNGFITTTPFDVEYLTWYGTIIPNVWSEEKYL